MFFKSGDDTAHCIVNADHKEALEKLGLFDNPDKLTEKPKRTTRKKANSNDD